MSEPICPSRSPGHDLACQLPAGHTCRHENHTDYAWPRCWYADPPVSTEPSDSWPQ